MTLPRAAYASDLTDAQWCLLEPMLPPPATVGARRCVCRREIVNAILYLLSSGCKWHELPHDFPKEGTVRDYYHQWRRSGLWQQIHDRLRDQVRQAADKDPQPSALIIDSQSVKATRTTGARGYDAGKKNQRNQAARAGRHAGAAVDGGGASGQRSGS